MKGFTLIELLIVIAILAILASIGTGFFINYARSSEVNSAHKIIISNLKEAQAKSISGESGRKWGVHFENDASDYYELFSTPTNYSDASKEIKATGYLSSGIYFTQPAESASSTILFEKIRGTTASDADIIISSPNGQTKIINVTAIGKIY
jgi:prepilin-type N-terminal cleavage/methylation domain-containing protein